MSFSALSHSKSGLRSPSLASSMIWLAMHCDVVVAVSDPQGDANEFEGNTEDTPSLGVEFLAVKERSDRHSNASLGRSRCR
jgi:hypothetical protein